MSLRLYKIKDWALHFESHDSRKYKRLDWVRMPNKHDGLGFRRLATEKDAANLLAAWILIVQVASKCGGPDTRGTLARDGYPLTSADMAAITSFPAKIFDRAFAFFTNERIGWMVSELWQTDLPLSPGAPADSPGVPGDHPGAPVSQPHQRREEKIREDKTVGERAAAAAPQSDSEWLDSLKANPIYAGLDCDREYGKMVAWCQANNRQPSRRRFVNWLNRIERPIRAGAATRPTKPDLLEPHGWKSFLNHEYPDSVYSAGGKTEAHEWPQLPRDIQAKIIREMREKGY